jgi:hypothetical protein
VVDATEPWRFEKKFDFTFVRMLGDVPHRGSFFKTIYDNLNPGGWAEFTEWIMILRSANRSTDGTAFERWNNLLREGKTCGPTSGGVLWLTVSTGSQNLGMPLTYSTKYKHELKKLGFERITERKYAVPINSWTPNQGLKRVGDLMTTNLLMAIDIITMPVFTQGLGWPQEAVETLLEDVRKEVGDTRLHSFTTL